MLPQRLRRLLVRAGFVILAIALVYLSLRRTSLAEIGAAFRQADYWWCIPLVFVTLGSHLVRAWRWQALLEMLPSAKQRPGLAPAFSSVMIGIMVNYVLPRAGEIVRAANLSRRTMLPFAGVFGTIVTERVIDLATLALGLVASVFVLREDQRISLNEKMLAPALERLDALPVPGIAALVLAAALLAWWVFTRNPVRRIMAAHAAPLWASFVAGLATAHRSKRKAMLAVSTVCIWVMYGLMAYLPLEMFDIAASYHITPVDALVIMFVGVLGVVVPTPGGAGSFHYITILTLVAFYGVPESISATYAFFVHGAQLILYVTVGLLVISTQKTGLSQLRSDSQQSDPRGQ